MVEVAVEMTVERNSRREPGCAQRNTRFSARNIFAAGVFFCCAPLFGLSRGEKTKALFPILVVEKHLLLFAVAEKLKGAFRYWVFGNRRNFVWARFNLVFAVGYTKRS